MKSFCAVCGIDLNDSPFYRDGYCQYCKPEKGGTMTNKQLQMLDDAIKQTGYGEVHAMRRDVPDDVSEALVRIFVDIKFMIRAAIRERDELVESLLKK